MKELKEIQVNEIPTTKVGISHFASRIVDKIMREGGDAFVIAEQIKALETFAKALKDSSDLKSWFVEEFEKEGVKEVDKFGTKFKVGEYGAKYNFDNCGCSMLKVLDRDQSDLKIHIKERENFLKFMTSEVYDEVTGELLNKPTRTSTTSMAVSLAAE